MKSKNIGRKIISGLAASMVLSNFLYGNIMTISDSDLIGANTISDITDMDRTGESEFLDGYNLSAESMYMLNNMTPGERLAVYIEDLPMGIDHQFISQNETTIKIGDFTFEKKLIKKVMVAAGELIETYDTVLTIIAIGGIAVTVLTVGGPVMIASALIRTSIILVKTTVKDGKFVYTTVKGGIDEAYTLAKKLKSKMGETSKKAMDKVVEKTLTKPTGTRPNPTKFRNDALANTKTNSKGQYEDAYTGKYHDAVDMEADHIMPWGKGGSNSVRNSAMTLKKINRDKRDNIDYSMMARGYVNNKALQKDAANAAAALGAAGVVGASY